MEEKNSSFKIYVGLKNDPGDPFTNEVICDLLRKAKISDEVLGIEYRGKNIQVREITFDFAKNLYNTRYSFPLFFTLYVERNFSIQRFRLFEPGVRKKAKYSRYTKKRKGGGG